MAALGPAPHHDRRRTATPSREASGEARCAVRYARFVVEGRGDPTGDSGATPGATGDLPAERRWTADGEEHLLSAAEQRRAAARPSHLGAYTALAASVVAGAGLTAAHELRDEGTRPRFADESATEHGEGDVRASRFGTRGPTVEVIGDSTASGLGADGNYDPVTVNPGGHGGCFRSTDAYGAKVADLLDAPSFRSQACAGATIDDVLHKQVPNVDPEAQLIIATFGANGYRKKGVYGLVHAVEECLPKQAKPACGDKLDPILEDDIPIIGEMVEVALRRLKERAPYATIVLVGYQNTVPDQPHELCSPLRPEDSAKVNEGERLMKAVMRGAAVRAGVAWVDADDALSAAEGPCAWDSQMNDVSPIQVLESGADTPWLHGKAAGNADIASYIAREWSEGRLTAQMDARSGVGDITRSRRPKIARRTIMVQGPPPGAVVEGVQEQLPPRSGDSTVAPPAATAGRGERSVADAASDRRAVARDDAVAGPSAAVGRRTSRRANRPGSLGHLG